MENSDLNRLKNKNISFEEKLEIYCKYKKRKQIEKRNVVIRWILYKIEEIKEEYQEIKKLSEQ